jgi:hypothetical protein
MKPKENAILTDGCALRQLGKGAFDGIGLGMAIPLSNRDAGMARDPRQGESVASGCGKVGQRSVSERVGRECFERRFFPGFLGGFSNRL